MTFLAELDFSFRFRDLFITMLKPIGIIGAGGWGIALAKLLADKGEQVTLWCHGAEGFRELQENRESRTYLAGVILPSSIKFTRSIEAAVTNKGKIIRLRIKDIRVIGRNTQGVRLIDIDEGERVVSLARVAEKEDEDESSLSSTNGVPDDPV